MRLECTSAQQAGEGFRLQASGFGPVALPRRGKKPRGLDEHEGRHEGSPEKADVPLQIDRKHA